MILKFVFLFFSTCFADVLVTSAPGISPWQFEKDFKQLPIEIGPTTLKEQMLIEPIDVLLKDSLLKEISEANDLALKKDFKSAIRKYENLITTLENLPQVSELEKLTQISFLKLFEYYKAVDDSEKSLSFLKKAKAWDFNTNPREDMLSAEARDSFKNIKLENKYSVFLDFPKNASAFLNGKSLNSNKVELFEGKYQLAVLQEGYYWQIKNFYVNAMSAKTIKIHNSSRIIGGSCEAGFEILQKEKLAKFLKLIVLAQNCQRVFDGKTWYTMQAEPIDTVAVNSEILTNPLFLKNEPDLKESAFEEIIKSPWFWGALSAIGIYVYLNANKQPEVIIPTHTLR